MKITRLKLVNFIGIKHGMNRDEIEINFPTDGKNKITMLSGQNGSGKSTIMSQLQPYKDSFDDRKDLIVEHKEGRKEIDILGDDGTKYTILHIYPADLKVTGSTVSCYIQADGVELNPSGTVRTFEDVIRDRFGITKDYFQIGKVGTNTQSFINLTTTERKEFFSRLIPSVAKYQAAYDEASANYKESKDRIGDIGVSLKKFQDKKVLEDKIATSGARITELDKLISEDTGAKAVAKSKSDELEAEMGKIDIASVNSQLAKDDATLSEYAKAQTRFEADFKGLSLDECRKKESDLKASIASRETGIQVATTNRSNSNGLVTVYDNDISKAKLKIQGMTTGDLKEIAAEIAADEETKAKTEARIALNFMVPALKGYEKDIPSNISRFEEFITYAKSHYKDLNEHDISPDKANVEMFFDPNFKSIIQNQAKIRSDAISGRQTMLDGKNSEYGVKSSNLSKLSILEKRPAGCSIDSCPFISDALKYVHLPEELKKLDSEISGIKQLLGEDKAAAERLSDVISLYDEFSIYYSAMRPKENRVIAYFVAQTRTTFSMSLQKPINELASIADSVVRSAMEGLEDLQTVADLQAEIDKLKSRQTAIAESEKNVQYFESEISSKTELRASEAAKVVSLTKEISDLSADKAKLEGYLSETTEYIKSKTESDGLKAEADSLRKTSSDYASMESQLKGYSASLKSLEEKMKSESDEKSSLQQSVKAAEAALINIDALDKELSAVKNVFSDQKAIRESLDPRKGIPLLFVQAYLGKTETIANELLDLAYNGKFKIIFAPTDKDFFIKVQTGTNMKDDITLASQGEIAMTTVSISLALIEQSLGKFNAVCLDEIDGPLDSDNRRSFISILKSQISKMNIDQVFIISHNDAFDSESMDMILLPGSKLDRAGEFMDNKRIIFDCESL